MLGLQGRPRGARTFQEPGPAGALVMAHAGINIQSVSVTTRGHLVFGVDDIARAIQVAGGMAVLALD